MQTGIAMCKEYYEWKIPTGSSWPEGELTFTWSKYHICDICTGPISVCLYMYVYIYKPVGEN